MTPKNNSLSVDRIFRLGEWLVDVDRNQLKSLGNSQAKSIEPKVMQLLVMLVNAGNDVVSRESLISTLWPDVVVGEDTLARTVSRLRSVLGDSASNSRYIQTIPKKGYALRIKAEGVNVDSHSLFRFGGAKSWVLLLVIFSVVVALVTSINWSNSRVYSDSLNRADDFYMKFTHDANEAAISLYETVLSDSPDDVRAHAGLANALVQRVVRWPVDNSPPIDGQASIKYALESGQLSGSEALAVLDRAQALAERAARMAPDRPESLKALGFVYSAQGKLQEAVDIYLRAIESDSREWRSLINLGEIYLIWDRPQEAIPIFTQAFEVMGDRYDAEPQHVGPWRPAVGMLIGQLYVGQGAIANAEHWFRVTLELAPLDRGATSSLVALLRSKEDLAGAKALCEQFISRIGPLAACE